MKHLAILGLLLTAGCTVVSVTPLDPRAGVDQVCIQENPQVLVTDFVPVVEAGFARHGIETELFSGPKPEHCQYVLIYSALKSWDFVTYLSKAELRLERRGTQIAYAEYRLRGAGGVAPIKFAGTKAKMDPVIDELLAGR
jgi:hypothetical protein